MHLFAFLGPKTRQKNLSFLNLGLSNILLPLQYERKLTIPIVHAKNEIYWIRFTKDSAI